ncbi:hypothetical protein [Amycolatopsis thermophila]|uniref:Uncharacterized protein n=1 Tax=Amycolatopsis thermophila TaxID=206084 RepID=A0ABU0EU30_9PSEU|nr:hypothetical protein [Amycolatopsis thermophila]MDQ0378486.1 hypothetical protein [Amycolatopsis thermophila]
MEDDRGTVDDGEFVVASGQAAPLCEQVEAAFDDIAAAVVYRVECRWPAAAEPRPLRCPIWSAGSAITAVMPRARNCLRIALEE